MDQLTMVNVLVCFIFHIIYVYNFNNYIRNFIILKYIYYKSIINNEYFYNGITTTTTTTTTPTNINNNNINIKYSIEENQLSKVKPVIEKRIAQYQTSEIRFNLMAVTKDPLEEYQNEMKEISQKIQTLEKEGSNIAQLEAAKMDKQDILDKIHAHEAKLNRYAIENARRRHNWFPFIIELLNILAKKGKLEPAIAASQEKTKKRREAKRQRLANANANATSSEQK